MAFGPSHAGTVDGSARALAELSRLVGLIDVMPTVLDVLRIGRDLPVQGRGLMPLVRGQSFPERPLFAEATNWGVQRALRTERC